MPTAETLGKAAPSAPATSPVDTPALPPDTDVFNSWAQANEAIASDTPEGAAAAPAKEPDAEPAAPEAPKTVETPEGDEAEAAPDEEAAPAPDEEVKADEEEVATADEGEIEGPVIELAEDEPFETFSEKVDKFLEAYDVDPSIVAMKEGYEKHIAELQATVGDQVEINDSVKAGVEAVAAIDEFRKDEETGRFIAKTNEIVGYIQANKAPETFKQFVVDALSAPSNKYRHLGYTMLHELYVDAGVSPARMGEYISYVSGDAQPPPLHPNLPQGVPQDVAEAYGKNSALRKVIADNLDTLSWSDEDRNAYPEVYAEAESQFNDAVSALVDQQQKINGDRERVITEKQQAVNAQADFNNAVIAGTQAIQKAELAVFAREYDEKIAPFITDPVARKVEVLESQQLLVNVLGDDIYGESARAELKTLGINVEYAKAQMIFQKIMDAVGERQTIYNQTGDVKAAEKAVEKPLMNALRELGVMRRNIIGNLAKIKAKKYVSGGLQTEAPKPKLRPMLKDGSPAPGKRTPKVDFNNPQEAGKWYGEHLFGRNAG